MISVQQAVDMWQFEGEARGLSAKTLSGRAWALNRFYTFLRIGFEKSQPRFETCGTDRAYIQNVGELESQTILEFYRWIHTTQRWNATTKNTVTRPLRTFLGYCKQRGWITFEPPSPLSRPYTERPVLTQQQLAISLREAGRGRNGNRNQAILMLFAATGLRLGELSQLNLADVDFQSSLIRIRPETSKSRRLRFIPLGNQARLSLFEYVTFARSQGSLVPTASLFLAEDGSPLASRGVQMILKRLSKRLGFSVSPHKMRHTFATLSLTSGQSLPVVQSALGHTSINTTSIYLNNAAIQEHLKGQQWTPVDSLPSATRSWR